MPCDTIFRRNQTISQRKVEVKAVVAKVATGLANGSIKAVVSRKGGIAFNGLSDTVRDDVTDACVYRQLQVAGSALALAAIAQAEMRAGVQVDRKQLAGGLHSHDGGATWHNGH